MSSMTISPISRPVSAALALLATWLLAAMPATAQSPSRKTILKSGPWTAMQTTEKGRRVCFVEAAPLKKRGAASRSDVYVHVIHRISGKGRKTRRKSAVEIGFFAGQRLSKKGPVLIKIGRGQFRLVPYGDKAWTPSPREDRRLLRSMIRGSVMIMRSLTAKGDKFEDRYSLAGFTRAYMAARAACGLKVPRAKKKTTRRRKR